VDISHLRVPSKFHYLTIFNRLPFNHSSLRSRSWSYFTTDSKSWCRAHFETCDQILPPVGRLLSESCGLVSVGLPLWREDGSAVCSAIPRWSESRRTRNILYCLIRDSPNPEGQILLFIVYPTGRGWPSYTPGHLVHFTSPLTIHRGIMEVFKSSPSLEGQVFVHISHRNRMVQSKITVTLRPSWVDAVPTVIRPIRLGVWHPFGANDQIFSFSFLLPDSCFALRLWAPFLTRGRVCNL
jgi:hypothetical protein